MKKKFFEWWVGIVHVHFLDWISPNVLYMRAFVIKGPFLIVNKYLMTTVLNEVLSYRNTNYKGNNSKCILTFWLYPQLDDKKMLCVCSM